ncbi:hypothetical protein HY498_00105 [Candidatus Woesearchaeota archaeon]|nr:hypothetical protein [Candidatus Woesearchaeota archaeon]
MATKNVLKKLIDSEDLIVPTIFKPGQFAIIKKINEGKKLTENEKRYLRGRLGKKISIIESLQGKTPINNLVLFLNNLNNYYITGTEALKHNGFGWYFTPKIIEIINTKIEGKINFGNKVLKFIRVKSLENREHLLDKDNGLKYATNEQILNDTKITKNNFVRKICLQMLSRYRTMFINNNSLFNNLIKKEKEIDYKAYGV